MAIFKITQTTSQRHKVAFSIAISDAAHNIILDDGDFIL